MNINIGRITAGFLQSKHLHCREWSFVITGICIGSTLGNYFFKRPRSYNYLCKHLDKCHDCIHINNKKKTSKSGNVALSQTIQDLWNNLSAPLTIWKFCWLIDLSIHLQIKDPWPNPTKIPVYEDFILLILPMDNT